MQPHRAGTGWLRAIWVALTFVLVADILYLVSLPIEHVHAVGSTFAGTFWQGDPYVQRLHPELSPDTVSFGITRVKDNQLVDYTFWQKALYLLSHGLAFTLATIPMIFMARRVIRIAIERDPFTTEMVRRLRRLGLVVLLVGLLTEIVEYVSADVLLRISVSRDVLEWADPDVNITGWWLMPGLIILAVAQIMRRGVAMREELDAVV